MVYLRGLKRSGSGYWRSQNTLKSPKIAILNALIYQKKTCKNIHLATE
jgi:hypothetical protein